MTPGPPDVVIADTDGPPDSTYTPTGETNPAQCDRVTPTTDLVTVDIEASEPRLVAALQEIHRRSPNARVC